MNNPRAAGRIRRRKECDLPKRDKQMNLLRGIALAGIATLLLVGCANSPYASPYDSANQRSGQVYQTQPRVIVVQPNRQSYGQSSRIYSQQGQIQQYDYYPGLQHQQPRQHQQWSQQHQYPRHGQQPRYDRHDKYDQHRDRNRYDQHGGHWSEHQRPDQRRNDQYQRPDYRAQQERYKEQRNQERENWERNRDRMLNNSSPQQYHRDPRRDQHRNYGSGIRQQRAERY
jgi:hypothetical protein